ncbi:MAG TPA: polysaccharide deacetylase family protein [Burkholderiales bacterium]|nr:polysaccharide deacetylase family protein [Burkholderiales bacterium]
MLGLAHDRILMYHGTPAADAAALERQLRVLSLVFPVVALDDIASGRGRNGRARIALTFDDGLRSNVAVAYPILRRLGLSATFFVCPGLIEHGAWLWNHEARERLRTLDPAALAELADTVGGPPELEAFVEWMKTLAIALRRKVEEAVRAATAKFKATRAQRDEFDLAGWEELARLDPRLVTIGSHTMSHPILTSLTADETDAELRESRVLIEARLQRPVTLFCYPNGNLNDAALNSARRHYRSAVTVDPGTVPASADPHLLPRFAAHARGSRRLARRMVFG